MTQSINHQAEFTAAATWFSGFDRYGHLLVGDQGIEFFNQRNIQDCVQIPWQEVDIVLASVLFRGKWIPRIGLRTRKNGTFQFACREPRQLLHHISRHIPADRMYRSWTVWDVIRRRLRRRLASDQPVQE